MNTKHAFLQHLTEKGKKQAYIDMSSELLDSFHSRLWDEPPSSGAIDAFVRSRWSGYVSRDKAAYQILSEYAGFCETKWPMFSDAFREHIRETFEGEAQRAMRAYKRALIYIPKDTKIARAFLGGMTNGQFVEAFKSLQELIYAIYGDIERGSPFNWGWPDWKAITAEGLDQNRVMKALAALTGSGHFDGDMLVVDKKRFGKHDACNPISTATSMLKGFMNRGFRIKELDNKKSPVFFVSYPDTPNLISALCSYFVNGPGDTKNHTRVFSYRFVEDPDAQLRETLFLAKTDGETEQRREIYYWLYDEAVKHGFTPQGYENMGCYVYKKGSQEWLLLGSGSSYHEDEFLHSVNYAMAAKVRFHRVFHTHPERIEKLRKRFPDSFGRPWTACFKCKAEYENCESRVTFKKGGEDYHHCGTKHHLYFHDPDFGDVKEILELYKLENKIKEE